MTLSNNNKMCFVILLVGHLLTYLPNDLLFYKLKVQQTQDLKKIIIIYDKPPLDIIHNNKIFFIVFQLIRNVPIKLRPFLLRDCLHSIMHSCEIF